YGDDVPLRFHPDIRSEEACYAATARIVEAATRIGARLHVMHISTARELELFNASTPGDKKNITAEACIAHLLFTESDYDTLGSRIKCNPAIKKVSDREALRKALTSGKIDAVATDHAPHLLCDKEGGCLKAASGMPMVQFSLPMMMDLAEAGLLSISQVSNLMSHAPAQIFGVEARGDIKEGYFADLTLVERLDAPKTIQDSMVVSRCGWTPLHGISTNYRVVTTIVNGNLAYNDGVFAPISNSYAKPISFKH
ncbi:MAG: amidohydrolase family protein, partial [Muribaculaceae bacterium]|nr:amidohydrolase family protein [Muribaculaceae bacterium]